MAGAGARRYISSPPAGARGRFTIEVAVLRGARYGALVASLLLATAPPARAANVPVGFQETLLVLLTGPGSIAFDPSGGLWITQHTGLTSGRVWLYEQGASRLVLTLPTSEIGERGIHTIEVDPDFATNKRIWLYYTTPGPPIRHRLSHFTYASGQLGSETVVLEGPPVVADHHNGGCLAFAADKTLYLGIGDDSGGSAVAQNPNEVRGKILHMNRDGTGAANPPWPAPAGDPRVWALGARNPFRCRVNPASDLLVWTDVGSFRFEEVNLGIRGANYGWAEAEGYVNPGLAGMTYPIYDYPSRLIDGTGAAIIGGDFAGPGDFAPEYEGNYFFGDWVRNEIHRMVLDASLQPVSVTTFATNAVHLTDLRFGPDGALYYTVRSTVPGVWRIAYDGSTNRSPVAIAAGAPDSGPAPVMAQLDASASYDPDQTPLAVVWDFGDSTGSSGTQATHAYAAGVYQARATVTDEGGASSVSPPVRIVSGNGRPNVTLAVPAAGSRFNAGDAIAYAGSASDPEDGPLACEGFTWQVLFHHNDHIHPYLGPIQGSCSGSFATQTHGETDPNVWYELRLSVSDSGQPLGAGAELTQSQSVNVLPNVSTIRLETAPYPGLAVLLDAVPSPAPITADSVVGLVRTIGAPNGQIAGAGRTWSWIGWSDGGAREHEIVTPATSTTYTATFGCKVITEATNLSVHKGPGDALILSWDDVDDACLATTGPTYRVYAASTARPTLKPGQFPTDPQFAVVATTQEPWLEYAAPPGPQYFLVVPVGTDLLDGPTGAY